MKIKWESILFSFLCLVAGGRIFTRCVQGFNNLHLHNFYIPYLWIAFLISFITYWSLGLIATLYSQLNKKLTSGTFYVGILLGFYFINLLNILTIKIDDTVLMRLLITMLIIPLIYNYKKLKKYDFLSIKILKYSQALLPAILILLWFVHSMMYCLEFNFNPSRVPYGDENSLWYVSSEVMISKDMFLAHIKNYAAKGLHPFGIPFISALPNKIFGLTLKESIFFMPIAVIFSLFMVLRDIRVKKWTFLFFISALFCTFNSRSWISQLSYNFIYGEGLSTVFFLIMVHQIFELSNKDNINKHTIFLMIFIIGLLALSKSPLAFIYPLFFVVFLLTSYGNFVGTSKDKSITVFLGLLAGFMPYCLWKIFRLINFESNGLHFNTNNVIQRLLHPNLEMLGRIGITIYKDSEDILYYFILSVIFIVISRFKKIYSHLIPVATTLVIILFYYGFIYCYGKEGCGDHASSLRYLMTVSGGLFYLGGLCFEQMILKIENKHFNTALKYISIFLLSSLVLLKLF